MNKFKIKTAVIGIVCAILCLPVITKAEDKWQGIATFDPAVINTGGGTPSFSIGLGAYKNVHPNAMLGFGAEIAETWNFKGNPSFPLFVGLHAERFEDSFSPTFDFRTGYSLSTQDFDYSTFFINPMVGVRFNRYGLSVGYLGGIAPQVEGSKWSSAINIRFSYYFGYHPTRMSKALKKTNFVAEVTADVPFAPSKYGYKFRFGEGINLGLLYPISEKFELGPMIGLHFINYKEEITAPDLSFIGYNNRNEPWAFLALRGKYRFRQISVANKFYPWAQLDLGVASYENTDFYYSPAIGFSYDVRDGKSSIDLGIGYGSFSADKATDGNGNWANGEGKFSVNIIRISLGYTF